MDEVADIRQSALALLGDLARVCFVTIFLFCHFQLTVKHRVPSLIQAKMCVNCPQMTEANLKPESQSNSSTIYKFGVLGSRTDYSLRNWHQFYRMLFVASHSKRLVQCICDVPFSLNAYS